MDSKHTIDITNAEMGLGLMPSAIGKHGGFSVLRGEDGFSWANGGYFDTFAETCEDIDDWNYEDSINDPRHPNFGNVVRAA